MKKYVFLLVVAGLVLTSGCASIIKGTSQTVTFNSDPDDVTVIIDGKKFGVTPLSVKLKKSKYSNVIFMKKGYKSRPLALQSRFDGVALINIAWDLGTTDLITGAIYEYNPSSYYVELRKLSPEEIEKLYI